MLSLNSAKNTTDAGDDFYFHIHIISLIMKYSDILFEKTCVSLYIQKHCTGCKMLWGWGGRGGIQKGRELRTETCRLTSRRVTERMMGCKRCKTNRGGVKLGSRGGGDGQGVIIMYCSSFDGSWCVQNM